MDTDETIRNVNMVAEALRASFKGQYQVTVSGIWIRVCADNRWAEIHPVDEANSYFVIGGYFCERGSFEIPNYNAVYHPSDPDFICQLTKAINEILSDQQFSQFYRTL